MPTINDKNIIWQVKEVNNTPIGKIDGKDYYDEYGVVFIEADYPAPTLSIKCDSDTIKVGSSAVCSLYINNQMELQTVDMTIESNIFDIDDIVPAIGWSFKKNTDGSVKVSYVKPIINKASEDEENLGIKIIDFKATATEDVDTETLNGSVEAKNIEYEDEFVTRNLDTVKTEIEIEQEEQKEQEEVKQEEVKQEEETEKVENPKTGIYDYTVLIILIIVAAISAFMCFRNKEAIKKI